MFCVYTLIALAMSWPLPRYISTHIPYGGGDDYQFMWNMWWFRQVLESGTNPFSTWMLYYPYGVPLVFSTLVSLGSAATIPLQWVGVDLITCYNLLLLLSSIVGAWTMWALARRLTGSSLAAFVAGLIYGWSPYHSSHVIGHLNLASHHWLPLYVLATMCLLDSVWPYAVEDGWRHMEEQARPWRWAFIAGCTAAAVVLTEITYAAFLLLWTGFYLLYRAWPLARAQKGRVLARAIGPLVGVATFAALLASPLLVPMAQEYRRATYMQPNPAEAILFSADVIAYLIPNELHPWAGPRLRELIARMNNPGAAERIVTLGYTVPLLCLVALVARWRARGVRFWAWVMVVFAVLSFGPVLHILGRNLWTVFRANVILPYAVLYYVPGFSVMRTPGRFGVMVSLGGALLAAYGLVVLQRRWPRARRVFPLLAAVLIAAEFWVVPTLFPPEHYAAADTMRQDPLPGAVFDVPYRLEMPIYLWYQTQHERPIVGGKLSRQPPDRFAAENPVLQYLEPQTPVEANAAVRDGAGIRSLQHAGIRYVVIHWWAVDTDRANLERKLAVVFGDQRPIEHPVEQANVYLVAQQSR
jgi:hypothetical protein